MSNPTFAAGVFTANTSTQACIEALVIAADQHRKGFLPLRRISDDLAEQCESRMNAQLALARDLQTAGFITVEGGELVRTIAALQAYIVRLGRRVNQVGMSEVPSDAARMQQANAALVVLGGAPLPEALPNIAPAPIAAAPSIVAPALRPRGSSDSEHVDE